MGTPWKEGVITALGWNSMSARRGTTSLGSVRGFQDLEPDLLGPVEQLIDFVTAGG